MTAQVDYDPSIIEHNSMLSTIYQTLVLENKTSSNDTNSIDVVPSPINIIPSTGKHWERIGFQGMDPRTDLNRSMKMLSILQVP